MPRSGSSLSHSAASVLVVSLGVGMAFAVAHIGRAAVQGENAARDGAKDRPSLVMVPDREFASSSYVHRKLPPNTPRDARSNAWVFELQRQIRKYYGVATVNIDRYTPPLYVVADQQPTVRVRAERTDDPSWSFEPLQQQWEHVPLPDTFEASAGTDKEAIVYQPSSGHYWEFWGAEKSGRKTVNSAGESVDEWRAAWGGEIDDLAKNPGYFETTPQGFKFGTAASGLALLGGLITIAEQRQGVINHAVHIALPRTRRSVWADPAQRTDGEDADRYAIPEGTTFRIPANVDIDQIDMEPYARMLARAVQTHGMVVRDTAGAVVLYAENPLSKGAADPYFGLNGILQCPNGRSAPVCYPDSNNRLRGFPWEKLEAVQATLRQ